MLAYLLRRRLDEEGWQESVFEGQVLSLTRRGMFVLFERLFQGYLSTNELPRDYYELNELETAMEGKRGGRAYKVADLLPVRVIAVDEARGRVDLTLVGDPDGDDGSGDGSARSPGAARPGSREARGSGGPSSGRSGGSRKAKTTRTRAPKAGRPPQGRGRR